MNFIDNNANNNNNNNNNNDNTLYFIKIHYSHIAITFTLLLKTLNFLSVVAKRCFFFMDRRKI